MVHLIRKTRRLTIRPMQISDYAAWRNAYLFVSPQKNRWEPGTKTEKDLTRGNFQRLVASQKKLRTTDHFYDLSVFENRSGKFVGVVAVMNVERGLAQAGYLGYLIFNQFWGNGYGKEASLAIIDIAFKDLKLHRIEAGIEPENRRSIMLARALGLRKEGLKKRAVFLRNHWRDLVMYSATCEEFGIKWTGSCEPRRL